MEITLQMMLDAREKRVSVQSELISRYQRPMICFTMNIAGPVKNSPLIRRGFEWGNELLKNQLRRARLPVLHFEERNEATGNEAFYIVDADPLALKELTAEIEDGSELGRLFDMDVLDLGGTKIERETLKLKARRCLICNGPAKECARSRRHSVQELQQKTRRILREAFRRQDARSIARLASRSLLYEICTTPKPGLVDRANNGSHKDMDIFSFMSSVSALWPYFMECGEIGGATAGDAAETFRALRWPGKQAEDAMMEATGNVNTHKGAIFSMGIVCAALGRLPRASWRDPARVLNECAAMTKGLVDRDFAGLNEKNAWTVGQRLYLKYGITGIRGQAEAGFPAVLKIGLPVLEQGVARGMSLNDAGCAALLALIARTTDTNLIARSDRETQLETAKRIRLLLDGNPFPDHETIRAIDDEFIRKNLSPGGSADLLAISYCLYFLKYQM